MMLILSMFRHGISARYPFMTFYLVGRDAPTNGTLFKTLCREIKQSKKKPSARRDSNHDLSDYDWLAGSPQPLCYNHGPTRLEGEARTGALLKRGFWSKPAADKRFPQKKNGAGLNYSFCYC